jgi:hypothetical protein
MSNDFEDLPVNTDPEEYRSLSSGRLGIIVVLMTLAFIIGVGVTVYALTSTMEDVTSNTEAVDQAKRAADNAQVAIDKIERESAERRNQTCALFERQHLDEVDDLKRRYRFLSGVSRSEYGTTLIVAAVQQLPILEQKARVDSAPGYCDEPGEAAEKRGEPPIGLPEPDPELPKKRDFSYLLRRP